MKRLVTLIIVVSVLGGIASVALAAGTTGLVTVQWSNKPLADVLGALKEHFGINYVLPSDLGALRVSVNLMNATPAHALALVVKSVGLQADDHNGTWTISQPEGARGQGGENLDTFAQFGGGPGPMGGFGGGGMMGGGANPAGVPGAPMPGPGATFGAPPGRGGPGAGLNQPQATTGQVARTYTVIPLLRAGPYTVGYALGANDYIYDMDAQNGNSSNGGGNGNSNGGGGNYGGGNNNSSSGGNRNTGGNNNTGGNRSTGH